MLQRVTKNKRKIKKLQTCHLSHFLGNKNYFGFTIIITINHKSVTLQNVISNEHATTWKSKGLYDDETKLCNNTYVSYTQSKIF